MHDLNISQCTDTKGAEPFAVDERGFCDVAGAAQYTGLSTSYLNKARHFGTGPEYAELGRAIRYSYAALDAWAAKNRRTSTRDQSEPER